MAEPGTILLAPVTAARKAEFLRLAKQSRGFHKAWVQAPDTEVKFQAFLKRARRKDCKSFFILEADSRNLVGVINISQIVRGFFQSAYLGYYVFKPYAGKGYMTEALGMVVEKAFTDLGLHRLEANIQPSNRASIKVAKKLGFRREGFSPGYLQVQGKWRDHERWALTAED